MKIESERLVMTPLSESELTSLFEMDRDPEVMTFIKRPTPTLKDAETKLKRYVDYARSQNGFGAYTVRNKSDGTFLGLGFLVHIELRAETGMIEVGCRLRKEFWGKGVATEIARTLIDFGFHRLKLTEIYGTTDPEHLVSQHILRKVGLSPIGPGAYHGGCSMFKIINGNQP